MMNNIHILNSRRRVGQGVSVAISSDIFAGSSDRFAVINLGYDLYSEHVDHELFTAYLSFRKNVYVDEMEYINPETFTGDLEYDHDDERSQHFMVVENFGYNAIEVVGCLRLIIKEDMSHKLPVENYYPEVFEESPANKEAIEVSRFISRNHDRRMKIKTLQTMYSAALAHAHQLGRYDVFGVVEKEFERSLGFFGVPVTRVGEPKIIGDYGDTINAPIRVDMHKLLESTGSAINSYALNDGQAFFFQPQRLAA